MSGGSLDYLCYKVEEAAEEMHDEELKMLMMDLSDVLHDLEWWTSCDIVETDYRETVKKFKQKWFGVHSNITAEVVNNLCDSMRSTLLSTLVY